MKSLAALILACAPSVSPSTMDQLVRVESGGDRLALNVNTPTGARRIRSKSLADAVLAAERELAQGNSVDVGLAQINSQHFERFGWTVADAFDPCRNLGGGATVLREAYARAAERFGPGQRALHAALSAYNTGSFDAGFRNGYVARFVPGARAAPTPTSTATLMAALAADTSTPVNTTQEIR